MRTKEVTYITGKGKTKTKIRLYADEGKVLTNNVGSTYWNCIDVTSADGWEEIDAPVEEEVIEE